jgi:ATP-dependent helicase/nuclease subunit A
MAAYAEITKQLYPDRTVECALLYTDGPNLIVLNPLDLSETLNGLKMDV